VTTTRSKTDSTVAQSGFSSDISSPSEDTSSSHSTSCCEDKLLRPNVPFLRSANESQRTTDLGADQSARMLCGGRAFLVTCQSQPQVGSDTKDRMRTERGRWNELATDKRSLRDNI
jgi:hypothetical protein